jgi:hypothetical protein
MNKIKYILKYFTLFVLFFLLITLTKFYGDYSTVIYFSLFLIPFIVVLIIINLLILYRFESKRNNTKVFKKTLSILLLVCGINLLIGYIDSQKTVEMNLNLNDDYRRSELLLFKDSSYRITTYFPHGTSNYSGKYSLENNILELNDSQIGIKTKNRFTNIYRFNGKTNQFKPTKNDFNILEIEK